MPYMTPSDFMSRLSHASMDNGGYIVIAVPDEWEHPLKPGMVISNVQTDPDNTVTIQPVVVLSETTRTEYMDQQWKYWGIDDPTPEGYNWFYRVVSD